VLVRGRGVHAISITAGERTGVVALTAVVFAPGGVYAGAAAAVFVRGACVAARTTCVLVLFEVRLATGRHRVAVLESRLARVLTGSVGARRPHRRDADLRRAVKTTRPAVRHIGRDVRLAAPVAVAVGLAIGTHRHVASVRRIANPRVVDIDHATVVDTRVRRVRVRGHVEAVAGVVTRVSNVRPVRRIADVDDIQGARVVGRIAGVAFSVAGRVAGGDVAPDVGSGVDLHDVLRAARLTEVELPREDTSARESGEYQHRQDRRALRPSISRADPSPSGRSAASSWAVSLLLHRGLSVAISAGGINANEYISEFILNTPDARSGRTTQEPDTAAEALERPAGQRLSGYTCHCPTLRAHGRGEIW